MATAGADADLARLRNLLLGVDPGRFASLDPARLAAAEARLVLLETRTRPVAPAPSQWRRGLAKRPKLALTLGLATAAGLILLALGSVERMRKTGALEEALRAAAGADARLAAYPLWLREDWSAGTVVLSGLAPSQDSLRGLVAALTPVAAPLALRVQVGTLVGSEALKTLEDRQAGLSAAYDADRSALGALAERLAASEQSSQAQRSEFAAGIETVKGEFASELAALQRASDKLDEKAQAAADSAKANSGQILELAAGLDALRAAAPTPLAPGETTLGADVAAIEALRVTAAEAAKSLAAATERARQLAEGAGEALAQAEALSAEPEISSFQPFRRQADALVRALSRVKSGQADAARLLSAEADRARQQAEAAETLKQRLDPSAKAAIANPAAASFRSARIRFGPDESFADPAAAEAALDDVVAAIRGGAGGVKVIGFVGAASSAVAKARAERVAAMLADRGVAADLAIVEIREAPSREQDSVSFAPLSP